MLPNLTALSKVFQLGRSFWHSLGIEMSEPQKIRVQSFAKKYPDPMCNNIESRFSKGSCKMLGAFSIFKVNLIPLCSTNACKKSMAMKKL